MPPPKFHYGTHYSTPAYVIHYLVRMHPTWMLCLQGGKFDSADRLFWSVGGAWKGVMSNQADLKELIPEFYQVDADDDPDTDVKSSDHHALRSGASKPDFLLNTLDLDLGCRHDGSRVHNVELPPWANNSPTLFRRTLRAALESPYVSARLHHWLDLIFGYKQRGEDAVRAVNVFHPLSMYGGQVLGEEGGSSEDDDAETVEERAAIEVHVREFGQTPQQVWTRPHPKRHVLHTADADYVHVDVEEAVVAAVDDMRIADDHRTTVSSIADATKTDNIAMNIGTTYTLCKVHEYRLHRR